MLTWISAAAAAVSLLVPHRRRAAAQARRVAGAEAFLRAPIAGMPALRPPRPGNDDLMAPVREAVERDLRRAGYLR